MSLLSWEHFFKPEVRSSGSVLFRQGKTSLSKPSDTEINIFIKTSTSFKVQFKMNSISDSKLFVDCNCPAGQKDLFCKHIWAGLLATENKNNDFFEGKIEIIKTQSIKTPKDKKIITEQSASATAYKNTLKEKQAQFRKEQYQKQKQKLKELKNKKNKEPEAIEKLPQDVEKALSYFLDNGFELRNCLKKEIIGSAKKKLARLFHPDLGGSHEEILALNQYTDILMKFTD